MQSIPDDRSYRADIDGLRAVAVSAVTLFHTGLPFVRGGFVGVDIFFVISGYLIGKHVYVETSQGRFSILEFYRRRAKRILPALLALLLFCYVIGVFLYTPGELAYFGRFSWSTLLSMSNVTAWCQKSYFSPASSRNALLMTWSLGVEEQFYLVLPLLMLAMGRLRRRLVFGLLAVLAVVSLLSCIVVSFRNTTPAFYLLR